MSLKKSSSSSNSEPATNGSPSQSTDDLFQGVESSQSDSHHGNASNGNNDGNSVNGLSELAPDLVASRGELTTADGGVLSNPKRHRRISSNFVNHSAAFQANQTRYNQRVSELSESITTVIGLLSDLQSRNKTMPIYYPGTDQMSNSAGLPEDGSIESPRLIPVSFSQEFNVFKLDLKVNSHSSSILNVLESSAVAALLDNKITETVKHLKSLRDRVHDKASKVLVTGDLNSGKSTFCNALLRRKLLPEDQQPLTAVLCEVINFRENNMVEEVHAVHIGKIYDKDNEETYAIFGLEDLDSLVTEYELYSLLKIYVEDKRPRERSLLNNGIVDITLIDAPGLNMDSFQTTQVFSRQEEIDLVIFVVSAENHFTQSAKEFISSASSEKSFIYIVVNKFDTITDTSRCVRRIEGQIADLSPETHKDSREFVHYVSSKNTTESFPDGDSSSDSDEEPGDNGRSEDNSDFRHLEDSLRRFVLEKRSISKLAPARKYLLNLLSDLSSLCEANLYASKIEKKRVQGKLNELRPNFDKMLMESTNASEEIDSLTEALVSDIYKSTKSHLEDVISKTGGAPVVSYSSFLESYDYASMTRDALIEQVQSAADFCESQCRQKTADAVNKIKLLGIAHLGEDQPLSHKVFNPEMMFSRRRDILAKSITAPVSVRDFFDVSLPIWLSVRPFYNEAIEDKALDPSAVNNALTLVSVVGGSRMILNSQWLRHGVNALGFVDYQMVRKLFVPAAVLAGVLGVAYVVRDIPNTVPRQLSKRIRKELLDMDYVHSNADRISKECRKVLKYPAQDIRSGFQTIIEQEAQKRNSLIKSEAEIEQSSTFFQQLHIKVRHEHASVESYNLDLLTVD